MFEVGKKVICIKDHSAGVVKKGDVFELQGIKKSQCRCKPFLFDIGLPSLNFHTSVCVHCGKATPSGGIRWLGSDLFAPYDDSLSEITADELIEELETVHEVTEII